jgi:hypothetical protein
MAKSQSKTQSKMTDLVKLKFESSAAVRKDRMMKVRNVARRSLPAGLKAVLCRQKNKEDTGLV